MDLYSGTERRLSPRVNRNFLVRYRIYGESSNTDVSQTINIGEGGMLLTTSRRFTGGTILSLELSLPFAGTSIRVLGKAIQSREIAKDLIYETQLNFTYLDEHSRDLVRNTVTHFLKEGGA